MYVQVSETCEKHPLYPESGRLTKRPKRSETLNNVFETVRSQDAYKRLSTEIKVTPLKRELSGPVKKLMKHRIKKSEMQKAYIKQK